jgi:hypothetical protein
LKVATPVSKNRAVIFGDSNAKGLSIDNPDYEITKMCRAGAMIQDISDLIDDCSTSPENVDAVLIQLGTCNWSADSTLPIATNGPLYVDYVEALNSASSKYPQAELLVSSIPQRLPRSPNGRHISAINAEVIALNQSLRTLASNEDNITFIDNDAQLTRNGEPDAAFYMNSDKTGVHLNKSGLALVSHNISKGLGELFSNSTDDAQWQTK